MSDITLLATRQARVGFEFVYHGGAPVCRTCPYRNACLTLDAGRRYRVTRVRSVEHPCVLQETSARVVEVTPVARSFAVEARGAIVGSSLDVERYDCGRLDCASWAVCAGPDVPTRQRFRIERVEPGPAECRIGRSLRRVEAV